MRMSQLGPPQNDRERYYDTRSVDAWVLDLCSRLGRGDAGSVDAALEFLERDPYFFRSGYARERVARGLARAELTPRQKIRARAVVLSTVDGERHCPLLGVAKLASAAADNSLRRELRARLHDPDTAVARRALRVIVNVRKPGLTAKDVTAARALVLADAARGAWLSPTVARLATYVWSREWEVQLRSLLRCHGPDRAAAKRLLAAADQRRKRRPAP
jgi:hypothetical protein